ncbi:MAG: hypothetical protein KGM99_16760 [Burkholderiales bacterium]|nr:hypothetical protein [Burkholderiales bacterium]
MQMTDYGDWFAGLKSLSKRDFPKRCANCGRIYETEDDYIRETHPLHRERSGLKAGVDHNDAPLLELYRNCDCGSTLLALFADRRDASDTGDQRRQLFNELLEYLAKHGIERGPAHRELLRVIRGERSAVLEAWTEKNSYEYEHPDT